MALTRDVVREWRLDGPCRIVVRPIKAGARIFEGAYVRRVLGTKYCAGGGSYVANYTREGAQSEGMNCSGLEGVAVESVDNTSGGDGAKTVRLRTCGFLKVEVAGVSSEADTTNSTPDGGQVEVRATDDGAATIESEDGPLMGVIIEWITGGWVWLDLRTGRIAG